MWYSYLIALTATIFLIGMPTDRIYQATWIILGLTAFAIDRPWRDHLRILTDWVPLIAALVVYDLSRGIAHELGMPIRVEELVSAEKWLFRGAIPTVWLQEHLADPAGGRPGWTVFTGAVYTSHFILPWLLAAVLYIYSKPLWSKYMRRVLLLSYLGLLTYILLPSAPPWYASDAGAVTQDVRRLTGFGFDIVPTDVSTSWLEAQSNPVAALPSLHAGFALLVTVALWPLVEKRLLKTVLALFPLAMAFALVFGGEHYVVDVVMGWIYVGLAILLARGWEGRRFRPGAPHTCV
ncbi:MAG: phosphatase PAP2 family protein [Rhodococcus sp. (in: high G+C Gram-positive bacteria)]|uniref:phosphatase PAP2 family protein n=1 Tax=Rhodococcus sp. TaxID=1831 RepID=UPI003BAF48EC